jgi:competence protein ComEA
MRKSPAVLILAFLILTITTAAFADAVPGVVNINTADAAQLAFLPRIGVKAAQSIVAYRTAHGPFHKATDLMQVKGFGEKRFEKLSAYLTVDGKTTLATKVSSPRKARKPTRTAS